MVYFLDATVVRNASETEHREGFVSIVGLQNSANALNSCLVLIIVAKEVKAVRATLITVRCRIVNCAHH